jgi:hypothetical protein
MIALGTQGVPGVLVGGRVNPLALKMYCPFSVALLHFLGWSAAASPGRHRISGIVAAHLIMRCFMGFSPCYLLNAGSVQRGPNKLNACFPPRKSRHVK